MRVEAIKVILLKKEYLESIEGQNALVNIVNGEDEIRISFSEDCYGSAEVALEALYCKVLDNELLKYLFFGDEFFEYSFTPWECELNQKNPSEEQIVEYIKNTYKTEDEEEIECIMQSTEFHDMVQLRCISPQKVKEMVEKLSVEEIMEELASIEKTLNDEGIGFDEWNDEENRKFIGDLLSYLKKASDMGIGMLYAHLF